METSESYYSQESTGEVLAVNGENTVQDHRTIMPVSIVDVVASVLICMTTGVVFILLEPRLLHPCVVPLIICGTIIGIDAMRWVRGGVDTFDPKGIIGIFGLNFFLLAPLLVVYYDVDIGLTGSPPDWRPWIGMMGWFNVAGIILYQLSQGFAFKHTRPAKKIWTVALGKGSVILMVTTFICIVSWIIVMVRMGGFSGVVEWRLYRERSIGGLGIFRLFAIIFMLVLLINLTVHRKSLSRASVICISVILIICSAIQFLTVGLGGSRINIMIPIVWAVGIIHYYWRDLSAKKLLLAMIPIMAFNYVYGLYKAGGERFIDIFHGRTTFSEVIGATNERITGTLVVDVGRADIQAWMLYNWTAVRGGYELRYGKTYLWAPFTTAPRWLFRWRRPGSEKVRAATEFIYGKGFLDISKGRLAGKVYGLGGEPVLNFGPWAIPFAFVVWGLGVGYVRRKWISWPEGDSRLLLGPAVSIFVLFCLLADQDVVWSVAIRQTIPVIFLIFFISTRNYFDSESVLARTAEVGIGSDVGIDIS